VPLGWRVGGNAVERAAVGLLASIMATLVVVATTLAFIVG
jgi:hypothetical protein